VSWRARQAARRAEDAAALWRFRRAVSRTAPVERVLAAYATDYCRRPLRRREVLPMTSAIELPGVTWSIDGDVMAELLVGETGPSRLVVHEVALLAPLRKALRTRHVQIEHRCLTR
jgi:hypothetical protein